MPSCARCCIIIKKTDDVTCKDILNFCMTHNISPNELIDLANGRYAEILDAFDGLPADAKSTILSLADPLAKARASALKPNGQSKKSKNKKKSSK